jgi:hypothetical protein
MRKITIFLALSVVLGFQAQAGYVTSDKYKFEINGELSSSIPTGPSVDAELYSST